MAFNILLHPKAAKTLEKLEEKTKRRVREQLRELRKQPDKVGKQLRNSNFWSIRIGDYRAIYEIDLGNQRVIVLFIGHRKKVYDDFSKIF